MDEHLWPNSKLKRKKEGKVGEGKGERENIPRVKALIITLNPAERKKKKSQPCFLLFCVHTSPPVAMERVCESACVCE